MRMDVTQLDGMNRDKAIAAAAAKEAYNRGYKKGREQGYDCGLLAGIRLGRNTARYDDDDVPKPVLDAYDKGFQAGYDAHELDQNPLEAPSEE